MLDQTKEHEPSNLVCVGAFAGAHGVHGQVRIKSFCSSPKDIALYQPLVDESGTQHFKLQITAIQKSHLVAQVDGLKNRDQAQNLKGLRLFASRQKFSETAADEFYHADLIGLTIVDKAGDLLGTIKAVLNFGAGDILEVAGTGTTQQIPFTKEMVPIVDIKKGVAVVNWASSEN